MRTEPRLKLMTAAAFRIPGTVRTMSTGAHIRRRRGFTLLEVGVAAALFSVALGLVSLAVARAQYAAASSRNVAATAQEVEFLLERVAARGGEALSSGPVDAPDPCPEDTARSCMTVRGRTVRVSWSVEQGLLWRTASAAGGSSSLKITATATSDAGFTIERSTDIPVPPPGTLLRVVPRGGPYDGPVFIAEADGRLVTYSDGYPVGTIITGGAEARIQLPEGRCLTAGECYLALAPNGSTSSGNSALSPESVLTSVVVVEGRISEHTFDVHEIRTMSVLLEATDPSGRRANPSVAGSVCLWINGRRAGLDVTYGGACNDEDATIVTFATLTPDPSRPHALASLPEGENLYISTSTAGDACPAITGSVRPYAGEWIPTSVEDGDPAGTLELCADEMWGEPTALRSGFQEQPSPVADTAIRISALSAAPFPVLMWSAVSPDPLQEGAALPAAGTVGSERIHLPWQVPYECSSEVCQPVAGFTTAPMLDLPVLGSFGTQGLYVGSAGDTELTVPISSATGATTITALDIPSGAALQVYDRTYMQPDPPEVEEPGSTGPWLTVAEGAPLPGGAYDSGEPVRLRFQPSAGFQGGALILRATAGGRVSESTLWLLGDSPPGIASTAAPRMAVLQGDAGVTFPFFAVLWSGELWSDGNVSTHFSENAPEGIVLSISLSEREVQAVVDPDAPPTAGRYQASIELPEYTAGITLSVLQSAALLMFPSETNSALSQAGAQGTSTELEIEAYDLSGAALPGWPGWIAVYDGRQLPARGVGSREVGCMTSETGRCSLTFVVDIAAETGPYSLTPAVGARSFAGSLARALQVSSNMTGLVVDSVSTATGTSAAVSARTQDPSGRPMQGVQLSLSGLPQGIEASVPAATSSSGSTRFILQVGQDVQPGEYIYSISVTGGGNVGTSTQARITVASIAVSLVEGPSVEVGTGGSATATIQASSADGSAISGRVLQTRSDVEGLQADTIVVTGASGAANISFSVSSRFSGTLPADVYVQVISSGQIVGEIPVRILPGLGQVRVIGNIVPGGSSVVTLELLGRNGESMEGRPVELRTQASSSIAVEGILPPCSGNALLACVGSASQVQITVASADPALWTALVIAVDGVERAVTLKPGQ